MTNEHVREFISDYLGDQRKNNPINDLIIPVLEAAFTNQPKNYWFGVDEPQGPFGLHRVDIFTHTLIVTPQNPSRANITVGQFFLWWADSKLRVVPDSALFKDDITHPVIEFDRQDELIDLAKFSIKALSELLTARIVVGKLEGK